MRHGLTFTSMSSGKMGQCIQAHHAGNVVSPNIVPDCIRKISDAPRQRKEWTDGGVFQWEINSDIATPNPALKQIGGLCNLSGILKTKVFWYDVLQKQTTTSSQRGGYPVPFRYWATEGFGNTAEQLTNFVAQAYRFIHQTVHLHHRPTTQQ